LIIGNRNPHPKNIDSRYKDDATESVVLR
jgi:hypothetical protein